jgi:hypothetical protein
MLACSSASRTDRLAAFFIKLKLRKPARRMIIFNISALALAAQFD